MGTFRYSFLLTLAAANLIPSTIIAEVLGKEQRNQVVGDLAALIETNYVEPELATRIATELREKSVAGDYASVAEPAELAGHLTQWLREFDLHFAVMWQPAAAEEIVAEDGPGGDQPAASRRSNFGFRRVERLPGNVGYLDLRFFEDPGVAGSTAASAMDFLHGSDAIIIDLRQNGGGSPGMVQLLCSYFFSEPTHLNSLYWRPTDETTQFWTLPHVSGRPSPNTPLYVLISERTGSAAEEFAYNMKTRERATLIGRKTAGAANPGDVFELPLGFRTFISTGKAINPVTGTNWEGVGVAPDERAPSARALEVALTLAYAEIEQTTTDELQRKEVKWAREAHTARTTFPPLPDDVERVTGRYGDRKIQLDGGVLLYQRGRRTPRILRPVTDEVYVPDGIDNLRILFHREGDSAANKLTEQFLDGFERSFKRRD